MKLSSKQLLLVVGAAVALWLGSVGLIGHAVAQTPAAPQPRPKAGVFFKNVSSSTLKGLSVDDFLQAMGVMTASLGYDCADCHPGAGSDTVNWVIDNPRKVTARKMLEIVTAVNKEHFGGGQLVTCWTCHHGRDNPSTTITIEHLYGEPYDEETDLLPAGTGVEPPGAILDRYLQALGGEQKWATIKSFIATGTASGFTRLGDNGTFQILAKYPDQRAVTMVYPNHPERGDSSRIYDGHTAWMRTPRALLGAYELEGTELFGARLDAEFSFPQEIRKVLTNPRTAFPDTIDGLRVDVIEGTAAGNILVKLFFDRKTGLLVRTKRFGNTPVGHSPTQVDYGDYRDVDGVKFPFKYTFSWLDGKDSFEMTGVKTNVPIDPSKFGKPN
jgi:hypothetical protein